MRKLFMTTFSVLMLISTCLLFGCSNNSIENTSKEESSQNSTEQNDNKVGRDIIDREYSGNQLYIDLLDEAASKSYCDDNEKDIYDAFFENMKRANVGEEVDITSYTSLNSKDVSFNDNENNVVCAITFYDELESESYEYKDGELIPTESTPYNNVIKISIKDDDSFSSESHLFEFNPNDSYLIDNFVEDRNSVDRTPGKGLTAFEKSTNIDFSNVYLGAKSNYLDEFLDKTSQFEIEKLDKNDFENNPYTNYNYLDLENANGDDVYRICFGIKSSNKEESLKYDYNDESSNKILLKVVYEEDGEDASVYSINKDFVDLSTEFADNIGKSIGVGISYLF